MAQVSPHRCPLLFLSCFCFTHTYPGAWPPPSPETVPLNLLVYKGGKLVVRKYITFPDEFQSTLKQTVKCLLLHVERPKMYAFNTSLTKATKHNPVVLCRIFACLLHPGLCAFCLLHPSLCAFCQGLQKQADQMKFTNLLFISTQLR